MLTKFGAAPTDAEPDIDALPKTKSTSLAVTVADPKILADPIFCLVAFAVIAAFALILALDSNGSFTQ